MDAPKRRKPVPHHRRPAPKKKPRQFTGIASEILSMILAALIFAATVWQSVFGMSGVSDQRKAILEEVTDGC